MKKENDNDVYFAIGFAVLAWAFMSLAMTRESFVFSMLNWLMSWLYITFSSLTFLKLFEVNENV